MDIILAMALGSLIGSIVSNILWHRKIMKIINSTLDLSVMELPELTTEFVDSSIRLYEKGVYLCQGKTIDEVAQNFSALRSIKLVQVKHNEKNIWFVDGKVQAKLD